MTNTEGAAIASVIAEVRGVVTNQVNRVREFILETEADKRTLQRLQAIECILNKAEYAAGRCQTGRLIDLLAEAIAKLSVSNVPVCNVPDADSSTSLVRGKLLSFEAGVRANMLTYARVTLIELLGGVRLMVAV
ncbi:hypothetical protein [Vibrio phage LV6]|nr:hypothetical protein [Vibrio phage LV6]